MRNDFGRAWTGILAAVLVAGCSAQESGVTTNTAVLATTTQPSTPVNELPSTDPEQPDPSDSVPDTTAENPSSDAGFAPDPEVRTGTLGNGLRYYIRDNNRPGGQAELRMAVNAGSVLEEPDQSAVAHFLEHMMFNGTAKYPKNELIAELRKLGSEFGADINAYTSFDETVYQLKVPNDDRSLTTGLDILHEWLTAAVIAEDDVVGERGVVLDEYRTREETANGRIFLELEDLYLAGSDYEGRAPIGAQEAITAMNAERLRRFYDDWYRPDNAAIVVVGEVDVDAVEAQLGDVFGSAVARGASPERPDIGWKRPDSSTAAVFTDPDLTSGFAQIVFATEAGGDQSLRRRTDKLGVQLGLDAVVRRIDKDIKRGTQSFNSVGVGDLSFARPIAAPGVFIDASNADVGAAYGALLDEFARVRQFGFKPLEIDAVIAAYLAGAESTFESSGTRQDAEFADLYVANFLSGEPFPLAADAIEFAKAAAEGFDADLVTGLLREWMATTSASIVVAAKDDTPGLPTEDEAIASLEALADRSVEDREDLADVGSTLMSPPAVTDQGTVSTYTAEPSMFVEPTLIEFDNGAGVIINPNEIADDYVEIYAVSPGGLDAVRDEDAAELWLLNEVNTISGLGDLEADEVQQVLAPVQAQVAPYPSDVVDLFRGASSAADLEVALQLLHQLMVASRFDEPAFDIAMARNRSYIDDLGADPDRAVEIEYDRLRTGGTDLRTRGTLLADDLDSVSLAEMAPLWTDRFGNASDFVFILSGDLDLDATLDLARTYIGTLPGTGVTEKSAPLPRPIPPGVQTTTVRAGTGNTASLTVRYSTDGASTARDVVLGDVLGQVLNAKLTEYIREELGASYSPRAFVQISSAPRTENVVGFSVSGAPDTMDDVAAALQTVVADLLADGVTADAFQAAIAEVGKEYELVNNGEIVQALAASLTNKGAVQDYAEQSDVARSISRSELLEFARRLLPTDNYIQVIQLPRG